tara:strand:+ start:1745 stop:2434 length:690 start_codon:yes stop_codon:yes gene_type:complete
MGIEIKIIEGVEYILKTKYDSTIQGMDSRISKLSTQKNEAETSFQTLQQQLDDMAGKLGLVDNLQTQNQDLQSQLSQSNSRYDRHSLLSGIGINDDSQRKVFDMFYNSHVSSLGEGSEAPAFGDWVKGMQASPDSAPLVLRSAFTAPSQGQGTPAPSQGSPAPSQGTPAPAPQVQPAPPANYGVVGDSNTMTKNQILDRAASDTSFYKQNRDMVKHLHNPAKYPKPEAG